MNTPRRLALAGLVALLAPSLARAQSPVQLVICPPATPVKYHDHYEAWLAIGSRDPGATAIIMDVWRTETARCGADSTIITSIVDSASARSPLQGAPPELQTTARMMRGTRETIVLSPRGKELRYAVTGITTGEVRGLFTGTTVREQGYRQWHTLPPEPVAPDGQWTDTVDISSGTILWTGAVNYRLRGVAAHDGANEAHLTSSGSLRTSVGRVDPMRVSADVYQDAATGVVRQAQIRQEYGYTGYTANLRIRETWRIERLGP